METERYTLGKCQIQRYTKEKIQMESEFYESHESRTSRFVEQETLSHVNSKLVLIFILMIAMHERWTGDSYGAAGSSVMKRKFHVTFRGGKRPATAMTYPTYSYEPICRTSI